MANKKDFKGVADSYFSKTTPIAPITPKASMTPKTPITPKASMTPITPKRLNLYIHGDLLLDIKKIAGIEGKKVNSLICEVLEGYVKTKSKAIEAYDNYHGDNA